MVKDKKSTVRNHVSSAKQHQSKAKRKVEGLRDQSLKLYRNGISEIDHRAKLCHWINKSFALKLLLCFYVKEFLCTKLMVFETY